jgi:hypothetical protein
VTDKTADETTVHACPPPGSGLTPCCGRTPFELPPTDRMSLDPTAVTCSAAPAVQAPAADRAALRDRIRRVLAQSDGFDPDELEPHDYQIQAAAIDAVLPAPADRAAVIAATARACAEHLRSNWTDTWTADAARSLDLNAARIERGEDTALLRRMADEAQPEQHDTLPAWLHQRFMPDGTGWDQLDDDDRSYWEHQARAVRRAVLRGGFKQPSNGAQQDGAGS